MAGRCRATIDGAQRDAELRYWHTGQCRDVVGHLALTDQGRDFGGDGLQQGLIVQEAASIGSFEDGQRRQPGRADTIAIHAGVTADVLRPGITSRNLQERT